MMHPLACAGITFRMQDFRIDFKSNFAYCYFVEIENYLLSQSLKACLKINVSSKMGIKILSEKCFNLG